MTGTSMGARSRAVTGHPSATIIPIATAQRPASRPAADPCAVAALGQRPARAATPAAWPFLGISPARYARLPEWAKGVIEGYAAGIIEKWEGGQS